MHSTTSNKYTTYVQIYIAYHFSSCNNHLQELDVGYHIHVVGFIHQNINLYTCLALCIFDLLS